MLYLISILRMSKFLNLFVSVSKATSGMTKAGRKLRYFLAHFFFFSSLFAIQPSYLPKVQALVI